MAVNRRAILRLGLLSTVFLVAANCAFGQLSTEDHVADPGFWPTQSQPSAQEFAGDGACARCHASMTASQRLTPMARTMLPPAVAQVLRENSDLSFQAKNYFYKIQSRGTEANRQSTYTVTDGRQTLSYPLTWAFGTGRVGQSYLFKKEDGGFYEARVTYFTKLHALGFTPARALSSPVSLEEAMYRPVPKAEVLRCLNCHSTGTEIAGSLDEAHLVPGVHCEACHGPGAKHVSAMAGARTGQHPLRSEILNPADLSPTEAVEFCGACHGSLWDVKLAHVTGVSTTRSAPYRLVTSRCWAKGNDPRLTCTACHDPHEQLETDAKAYDSACLQCHASRGTSHPSVASATPMRAACPVATEKCTTCHMPKVFVPEMNDTFTDHRIRIAKAGDPFPE